MSAITRYLPRKKLSRWIGSVARLKLPFGLQTAVNRAFAKKYGISIPDAELGLHEYPSLNAFFTRKLKSGIRPIAEKAYLVHPADSRITQAATITQGQLIQAKGINYHVEQLTGDPTALLKYDGGEFLTYYLCPTDYHRVHSPVEGTLELIRWIPGDLWPVNDWSTQNIPQLFEVNERAYVEIKTTLGPVGVVFVGATNVGSIEIFKSKFKIEELTGEAFTETFTPSPKIGKGEDLGCFHMGSTVVLLLSREVVKHLKLKNNLGYVKVNEELGQSLQF
ncbi:MAG: archaetidylserine decarboxylase [Bdellovibrionota bacterium]